MIVLFTLAMLPVLLAQDQGKAETCSYLAGKIRKLDDAITSSLCDLTGLDFAKHVIPSVCHRVSMMVIPPCMMKVGKAAQDQCMAEATKVIRQEYNAREEKMMTVEECRCNALGKSHYNFVKVKEMFDCSSSAARKRRGAPTELEPQPAYPQAQAQPQPVYHQTRPAYPWPVYPQAQPQPVNPKAQPQLVYPQPVYPWGQQAHYQPQQAFGDDTLWYQYCLCQEEDYYCHFFYDHWRQGDFGQYPEPHGPARESRLVSSEPNPDLIYLTTEPTTKQPSYDRQHGYTGDYLTNK